MAAIPLGAVGSSVSPELREHAHDSPDPRILSLLPAATEIVTAVGGADWLVGISNACAQPAGKRLPRVVRTLIDSEAWDMATIDRELHARAALHEKIYELDEERIAALAPTVVLSQGVCPVCAVGDKDAQVEAACARARLLVLTPRTLADVAENMRQVGLAIGRGDAGRVAARALELRIEAVRALPQPDPRPTVVVLEWFEPLWVSGEWIAEMVEIAGGVPLLATSNDPSRRASWNELVAADPDVIVLAACSMSIRRAQREIHFLMERPEWARLCAVRSDRVFLVDGAADFSSPGPGLAHGLYVLSHIARPGSETSGDGWSRVNSPTTATADHSDSVR